MSLQTSGRHLQPVAATAKRPANRGALRYDGHSILGHKQRPNPCQNGNSGGYCITAMTQLRLDRELLALEMFDFFARARSILGPLADPLELNQSAPESRADKAYLRGVSV